jgi:hypothetical protein
MHLLSLALGLTEIAALVLAVWSSPAIWARARRVFRPGTCDCWYCQIWCRQRQANTVLTRLIQELDAEFGAGHADRLLRHLDRVARR